MVLKDQNMSTATVTTAILDASPEPPAQPGASAAVDRCMEAWNRIYLPARANGGSNCAASYSAAPAFRAAMPKLNTPSDIRDFIACTAQGILIGAIDEKQASRLLYAAQVASGVVNRQEKDAKSKPTRKLAS